MARTCQIVELSDGKSYGFDDERTWKLRTICETYDEDFKTAISQHIPAIPKNSEVIYVDVIRNYYGEFIRVRYNGRIYDVKPCCLEYIEVE